MRLRSTKLTTGAAALALLVAGCGGTNLDLGGDEAAIDVDASGYEQAAGSICQEVADRFAEAQADVPRTFAQGEEVTDALLDIAREGEAALAELTAPAERGQAFSRYLDARAEVIDLLEQARDAAADEDGEAYEQARRDAVDGARERAELARRAALPGCARSESG